MEKKALTRIKRKNSNSRYSFSTVDDKGQIVINKDVRDWIQIEPGDKLMMFKSSVDHDKKGVVLVKVDDMFGDLTVSPLST